MRPLIGDQYSGKYPKIRQKTGVTMEKTQWLYETNQPYLRALNRD